MFSLSDTKFYKNIEKLNYGPTVVGDSTPGEVSQIFREDLGDSMDPTPSIKGIEKNGDDPNRKTEMFDPTLGREILQFAVQAYRDLDRTTQDLMKFGTLTGMTGFFLSVVSLISNLPNQAIGVSGAAMLASSLGIMTGASYFQDGIDNRVAEEDLANAKNDIMG